MKHEKHDLNDFQSEMKKRLKRGRYIHSVGVMYTAMNLAMRYDVSLHDAGVAGILHDCAKEMNNEELIKFCNSNNIKLTEDELNNYSLIHSKAGAYMAEKKYKITDENIINAIRYHTTGKPGMTRLEQIIYVADYIEPNRKDIPGLAQARSNVYIDIDKTCGIILENTIEYLKETGKSIDHTSIEACKYYN